MRDAVWKTIAAVASIGVFSLLGAGAAQARDAEDPGRVVVYYQSVYHNTPAGPVYVSPLPLLTRGTGVDVVNLGAIWLKDDSLFLNDFPPGDAYYAPLWLDIATLQAGGVDVVGMVGSADNVSWQNLHDDFDTYYPLLADFVRTYRLDGIDLDIETSGFTTADAEKLVLRLRADFGADFLITGSPTRPALADGGSGVDYQTLLDDVGDDIDWFNAQFYCGGGVGGVTEVQTAYEDLLSDLGIDASRVVLGLGTSDKECGDYYSFADIVPVIRALQAEYPTFGGVAGWEYESSEPCQYLAQPSRWALLMSTALRTTDPVSDVCPPVPVVSATPLPSARVGVAYSASLQASGEGPILWSATGLPAGLTLDAATGIVSGTPTAAGDAVIAVSADGAGGPGTANIALAVAAPVLPVTGAPGVATIASIGLVTILGGGLLAAHVRSRKRATRG